MPSPTSGRADTKIFTNWKTRTRIIAPGDVTGDYLPDLLSVDSGGALWIYPGNGNGTFGVLSTRSAPAGTSTTPSSATATSTATAGPT